VADSSEALLLRAVQGDAEALASLLEHFGPRVRAQLSIDKRWQAVLDEDDVMQVSYLEAFLQIKRLGPGEPMAFLAWLNRIAQNNLRDAVRGLSRDKRSPPGGQLRPLDGGGSWLALYDTLEQDSATPSRAVAKVEAKALLETAVGSLPSDYAQVVRLYDLAGEPMAEVAKLLGRSVGAAFMLRARAHDRLREALGTPSRFF
jgi:RNA polymerase sigma factor (sigma-70 family)